MDIGHNPHKVLESALAPLLRALFRVLLRHSMSFVAFEELAKRVYVDVAMKDFGIEGKKPTISRASILSGLTRKEVQRLVSEPRMEEGELGERYNRAARVLTGWVRDHDFSDPRGGPRKLHIDGQWGFAGLVKRYSGDMPARAVLDELVRVGAVRRNDDHSVELLARAYVPAQSEPDKLAILGSDVAYLIDTIDHNIQYGEADPRFQRKVMYHRIPATALPDFRARSAMQAQALLERLDRWLVDYDTDIAPEGAKGPLHAAVGVGIYYFEVSPAPYHAQGVES
jgi:hypothetical protein